MIDPFEQRLATSLHRQAQLLPDPLPVRRPILTIAAGARSRVRSGPLVALGTAVAVLLVLGTSLAVLAARHTTIGDDRGVLGVTSSAGWARVDLDATGWNLGPLAVGDAGAAIIAHAQMGNGSAGWFSSDGLSWKAVSDLDQDASIGDLAAGSFGFLAVGRRLPFEIVTTTAGIPVPGPGPAVWFSAGGASWDATELPLPATEQRIADVTSYYVGSAAGNGRVMVVAGDEISELTDTSAGAEDIASPSRPVVWRSTDGSTWELTAVPGWEGATASGSVAAGDATVAIAIHHGGANGYSSIWTSEDGLEWTAGHTFDAGIFVDQLVAGPNGFLAMVSDGALWFSPDGSHWDRVFTPPAGQIIDLISGSATRYAITLGSADFDPFSSDPTLLETSVYTSTTGRDWTSFGGPIGSGFSATDIAVTGNTIIITGNRYRSGRALDTPGQGEVWISSID
jgi:hypothetical protein